MNVDEVFVRTNTMYLPFLEAKKLNSFRGLGLGLGLYKTSLTN